MRAVAVLALLCLLVPAAAARSPNADAFSAFDSLATQRSRDGRFDPGLAPLLVEAAVAVGVNPAAWPDRAHPVLAALPPAGNGTLLSQVRAIHARAVAGHGTPQDVAAIQGRFRDGQYGEVLLLNDDIWALRALRALGVPTGDVQLEVAARRLAAQQDPGGGWAWRLGGTPSADVTGMALVALAQAEALPAVAAAKAHAYLAARQNATLGGYAEDAGAPNCDSTVWAIRGLHALGAAAPASAWTYLAGLHNADGGYAFQPGQPSNPLCTVEVAALLGEWLREGRDLSAYRGSATRTVPAAALPALLVGLAAAARRRGDAGGQGVSGEPWHRTGRAPGARRGCKGRERGRRERPPSEADHDPPEGGPDRDAVVLGELDVLKGRVRPVAGVGRAHADGERGHAGLGRGRVGRGDGNDGLREEA